MDEIVCPRCGTANPLEANFCQACGEELELEAEHTQTHPVVDIPGDGEIPMLVVVRGDNAGSRFALSGESILIGRHPDSDVFLDDVTVSRRHAEIRRSSSNTFEITDASSLNGTYVNGERIDSVLLAEGDQVQVGKFRLIVVVGGAGVDA